MDFLKREGAYMNKFMEMAIEEARDGIRKGHGGAFDSAIVKDGTVVAKGHNRVVKNNDQTSHGQIDMIRKTAGLWALLI